MLETVYTEQNNKKVRSNKAVRFWPFFVHVFSMSEQTIKEVEQDGDKKSTLHHADDNNLFS